MENNNDQKIEIEALQLAGRFAMPPNSMGFCGRDSAPERFKRCIKTGECDFVADEITKFIVLHPYIKTIAQLTNRSKFEHKVVESYCFGNDLLNEIPESGYDLLMDNFEEQGVPKWFVDEIREKKPKKFIPTHLFQVLHVGVGKVSGTVPFNLNSVNNCMIRWGKVLEVGSDTSIIGENTLDINNFNPSVPSIIVELNSLKKDSSGLSIHTETTRANYNLDITPNIRVGSTVAVHWSQTIKEITCEESLKLKKWSKKVIKEINPEDLEN